MLFSLETQKRETVGLALWVGSGYITRLSVANGGQWPGAEVIKPKRKIAGEAGRHAVQKPLSLNLYPV
jgi:hypothetical protein